MNSSKKEQLKLNAKVKILDDFNQNYHKSRNEIVQSIYETNIQLFEILSTKNKNEQ